jgi:ATP-binding cassette subfamily F protein uup
MGTKKAVFMVTHDRYFLENITDRIFELAPPDLFQYRGNYGTYLEKRAEREEQAARSEAKARNFLRTEVEWLRRMPKARGTKQKARIDRIHEVQNRKRLQVDPAFEFSVSGRRLGKQILEVKDIAKRFPDKTLFTNFTYFFKPGERIGIVGPNGVGKSSFLNVLTGKLAPDAGQVVTGLNTGFGYFDQTSMDLPADRRVLEFIRTEAGEYLVLGERKNETRMDAARVLEYFRFDGRLQYSVIERLSGGERRRLYLVYILMRNPNFLILDEPTNDLDVQTLSLLEDFLQDFPGCLLVVSHDRYFMDRVVDQLFIFGGADSASPTGIEIFPGSYAEYLEYREAQRDARSADESPDGAAQGTEAARPTAKKKRLSFKEQREIAELEALIGRLESEKTELESSLAGGQGDYESLKRWSERLQAVAELIDAQYARWNELAESVEELK